MRLRKTVSYEEYREKWYGMPKHFIQERMMCHLDIEVTTYCGLQCFFCPRTQLNLKSEHMPLQMAKDIIKEFAEKGGLSIKFVYLGEPLLYPHIFELISYAKELGILDTIIATNGNNLDYKKASQLIKSGLDYIIFSIDSSRARQYEMLRKGGRLSKVIKGLTYLNLLRNSEKPKIQIQAIPIPLCNDTEIGIGDYEAFWKDFADIIEISKYKENYLNLDDLGITPDFFCESPYRRITVRVNGDISLCCGSRIDSKIIGNYSTMSLEEAWNSEYMKSVRSLMRNGEVHKIESCRLCPYRKHIEGMKRTEVLYETDL